MHGHMAFFGAYVMIVLAVITYAKPALFGYDDEAEGRPATGRSGCRSRVCSA